jgi:hypothetical protein
MSRMYTLLSLHTYVHVVRMRLMHTRMSRVCVQPTFSRTSAAEALPSSFTAPLAAAFMMAAAWFGITMLKLWGWA